MKKFSKAVFVLGLSVILVGCLSDQDKANIEKVDELIQETQTQADALEATDYEQIMVHHDTIFANLGFLSRNLEDTVSKDLLVMLGDYRSMRKVYAKYKTGYNEMLAAAKTEIDQLNALKQDIENDIVKEEKFDKYFQLEQSNVNTIVEQIDQLTVKINSAEELYSQYGPVVDSLSAATREKLKAKKGNS